MHPKILDIITADATKLFNLDETALFNLKVSYGLRYLEDRFATDPKLQEALASHAEFWLWWRQLWAQRDRELMKMCKAKVYGLEFTSQSSYSSFSGKLYLVKPILHRDVLEFYEDFHYWSRVKFYPNKVLINTCASSQLIESKV